MNISATAVRTILRQAGLPPADTRAGLCWREFLRAQAQSTIACDFFTVETLWLGRLYVLFFIELGSRRVHLAGCTANPSGTWTAQVYRQTGGHAYHSPYAGPIGAILSPQLAGETGAVASLPFASSLCGACYDVCPVLIDIPSILVHERGKVVARKRSGLEGRSMKLLGRAFATRVGYERAQRLGRTLQRPLVKDGWITRFPPGPLAAWGQSRDLKAMPPQTFREWWESRDRA